MGIASRALAVRQNLCGTFAVQAVWFFGFSLLLGGVVFAAQAVWLIWPLRWHPRYVFVARLVWFACSCAGIRASLACFTRRPCAGRHLLFFAAAKKSRQKKAARTASSCVCLRAPTGSYASHGNHVTHVRCQRIERAPHLLHAPALRHAVPDSPPPPRCQTVCRPWYCTRLTPDRIAQAFHPVRTPSCMPRQPTHSLPPGRRKPFAAASLSTGI
ncbi:hypothetical protein SAMN04487926_102460 [Paraburkholderia steynii]|uniref:Uncharacterized protein n=1 Tax=Paraburkholderia steynii TaxID=1245441 RepID=A0A7Z7FF46_9BURK|nr:hypothetical protein SAMN04487926_102460 [Paraburkholderia steynii]